MVNTTGLTGAAPIWSSFMQYAVPIVSGGAPTPFSVPPGIMQRAVCGISGTEPSQWCRGGQYNEYFASDQPPLPASQDLLSRVNIDTWTGLRAADACKDFVEDELVLNVQDKWAREWLRSGTGKDWLEAHDLPRNPHFAPERECTPSDPHPVLEFSNINETSVITSPMLPINGIIEVKNGSFNNWKLEYGGGADPSQWNLLTQGTNAIPSPGLIHTWNVEGIAENKVTLRLTLTNSEEQSVERRVTLTLNLPTAVPSVTATPTELPTALPATATSTPTEFPTATSTPTEAPPATEVPAE
jgi:hypothetical protein